MEEKKLMQTNKRSILMNNSAILILVILAVIVAFVAGDVYNKSNLTQLIFEISLYGMVAVGLAIVMLCGGIDLSVGYLMAVTAVVVTGVLNATGSLVLAIILGLASGALMGFINGFLSIKIGINPLIATCAMAYIYNGVTNYFTNGSSLRAESKALSMIFKTKIFGLSFVNVTLLVFVVLLIVLGFVLRRTKLGNDFYVTGGNREAGRLAGIKVNKILMMGYIVCGICCAIAGLFLSSRFSGASYTLGMGRDIFAVSACVIGGISMAGGKGTMLNVLTGIVIMRLINTVMNVLYVPSSWTDFVSGMLMLLIIVADRVSKGLKDDD